MSATPTPHATEHQAHYISGTHWDREWYRTFQEFRLLFVELVDGLLELMEQHEHFRYFHFDGQTCVLQDYLDIRPENRERLARLIREGRILIGPWFTMPDLFCPGAEALIRNLLLGRRIARQWQTEPMPVAYTCDMFGHPSQMPQIYRGFGLPDCVLGRGTNEHTTPAFFRWQAPDGSTVFCFKLQDAMGYGAFVGARREMEKMGGGQGTEEGAIRSLRDYITYEIERCNGTTLCLMDALDHMPPAADAPRYLDMIERAVPGVQAEHSTLPAFFEEARRTATDVPLRQGELREPAKNRNGYLWLIPNCVSSRIRLKQANDHCQMLLERWVEPWMAMAEAHGIHLPSGFLDTAWRHVLLNHAHDSICGCSIDQVHRDMMHRFDQARLLADQLRQRAFGLITAQCQDPAGEGPAFSICIANPLPRERSEVVVFAIDFPLDWPTRFQEGFRSQNVNAFTLSLHDGTEVPYQLLDVIPHIGERTRFARMGIGETGFSGSRYRVAAALPLPALGFTTLVVRPANHPVRRIGSLRTGPVSADNGCLALEIMPNGTLTLTDQRSGEVYRDLLTFEDRSEIGDGWFHGHTVSDEIALSSACAAQVSVLHDGPEMVTFRVAVDMSVPRRVDWQHECRSSERIALRLVSKVSLRAGADRVEVETTLDNQAEDHRLRLLLPTDAQNAHTYLAHHPFDMVERPVAVDPQTATWSEMELAEKPFLGVQAMGDGKRGLAFLSAGGMHEGGVADDRRRTMLVTLLRSFRRTVGTPGERDGLELGTITWRYGIMPYSGDFPAARALTDMAALQSGLLTRQTGPCAAGFPPLSGDRPPQMGMLTMKQGTLVLSALKPAEDGDGCILRVWNPADQARSDTATFSRQLLAADAVALAEDMPAEDTVSWDEHAVTIHAAARKILTIRVKFRE